jgi:hypothetical protein
MASMGQAVAETVPRVSAFSAVGGANRKVNPKRAGTYIIRMAVACSAIRDGNGKPQFLLSVIDDVTGRAQET